MGVAAAGFSETIELRWAGDLWSTDNGEQVEFDFLMSNRYQAERPPHSKAVGAAIMGD